MRSRLGKKGTVFLASIVLAAAAVAGGALAAFAAHSTASVVTTKVTVTQTDYALALSTTSVPLGKVKFVVHNSSSIAHKFSVKGKGVSASISGLIKPGKTKSLTVTVKKGTYKVWCSLHLKFGMKAFVGAGVTPPTTASTTSGSTTNYTYTYSPAP